jgi:MYXO-CTERM domain-containing protein
VPENPNRLVGAAAFLAVAGLASTATAGNICNETVPSNHVLDGFPAYAQCTDSQNSPIYSNNGIDTATTSSGSDWARTQGSGGYQCTEWAHRYLYFRWNVTRVPSGNAGVWCDGTLPDGLVKTATPVHGDIIVFAPGSCGADTTTGHVAVVDLVNSNGTVTFVEQNRANRRSCAIDTAACFLHATANDGSVDGGTPDGSTDAASSPDVSMSLDARPDRFRDATGPGGSTGSDSGGSGGTTGTGGQTGAGGIPGMGGIAASGGATVVAGEGGKGGATGPGPRDTGDGCSCRLSRPTGASGEWLLAALAVGLVVGLRRRPRRQRPQRERDARAPGPLC